MISDPYCAISQDVQSFATVLYSISFTWLTLLYFLIGISGNVTLLLAFYRQSKEDGAYMYQVYLTISKILEVISTSAFNLFHNSLSGADVPGSQWFMRNWFGMFASAHILCPLSNWFMVCSLFCSVAMAADRVFAITRPFAYKNIDHRRHHRAAFLLSIGVSFLINLYDCWHWYVLAPVDLHVPNATYLVVANDAYLSSPLGMGLAHVRTAIRLGAVVALIVLNVILRVVFRRRTNKVAQLTSSGVDRESERARKSAERTLLTLTVAQSVLTLISNGPHSAHFVAIFTWVDYTRCYTALFGPIVDDLIMLADAAEFFVIIGVNRRMRRMVLRVLPLVGKCGMGGVGGGEVSRTSTVR